MKKQDLSGLIVGKLLIKERISESRNGHTYYKCECECGNECAVSHSHLKAKIQKSCGCLRKAQKGSVHAQWKGYEGISGGWWKDHVVRSADGSKGRSKLDLTITIKDLWELYLKQDRKCALTGLDIVFSDKNQYNTVSADRIDSSLGYIENNVQLVHKHLNLMKNKFQNQYFIDLCKLVANHNGGQ